MPPSLGCSVLAEVRSFLSVLSGFAGIGLALGIHCADLLRIGVTACPQVCNYSQQ